MRTWRENGFWLLLVAVCLAAAALSAVSFFASRVERGLEQQGAAALAADLVIESGNEPKKAWVERAVADGLQVSRTVSFPTVLMIDGKPQLVQVKGVDQKYPLRGELVIVDQQGEPHGLPGQGEAAAARRLFDLVGRTAIQVGLGKAPLHIDLQLAQEPDPGMNLFQLAPRLMVSWESIEQSGLIGPASRVKYRLLVAGERSVVKRYQRWVGAEVGKDASVLTVDSGRPEIASAVQRARRFLGLAALCASLLAGVGIMLATRYLVSRVLDGVAIMRTMGMTSWQVLFYYLRRFLSVALLGALAGIAMGYLLQALLTVLVAEFLKGELPPPSWTVLPVVIAHAMILVLGFSLPVLLAVQRVSPMRVLRRDLDPSGLPQWLIVLVAGLSFYWLIRWQAGDLRLANQAAVGLIGAFGVFGIAGWLLLKGLVRAGRAGGINGLGMTLMTRQPVVALVQLAGYSLSITVLLLLTLVRGEITETWRDSLPDKAPNYFLVNIQSTEVDAVRQLFVDRGIEPGVFYPTARGRLKTVNQQPLELDSLKTSRARRLATREYSLGFGTQLQSDNRILKGDPWQSDQPAFSVESGLAEELGLQVGDELAFEVAGELLIAPVTSIREVAWDSFNVNFFVQGTPAVLQDIPHAVLTSIYLDEAQSSVLTDLAQSFPAVSAIHIEPLLKLVREVIERSTLAVEGLFVFTLAAAVLISFAAVQVTRHQRQREVALMRTLGASNKQVFWNVLSEFLLMGIVASLLAVAAAVYAGGELANRLFNLEVNFSAGLWFSGLGAGTLAIVLVGYLAVRPVLQTAPMRI
ncbi:MAG: ABC transporter permease, partial [bacterium]